MKTKERLNWKLILIISVAGLLVTISAFYVRLCWPWEETVQVAESVLVTVGIALVIGASLFIVERNFVHAAERAISNVFEGLYEQQVVTALQSMVARDFAATLEQKVVSPASGVRADALIRVADNKFIEVEIKSSNDLSSRGKRGHQNSSATNLHPGVDSGHYVVTMLISNNQSQLDKATDSGGHITVLWRGSEDTPALSRALRNSVDTLNSDYFDER